jgi:microcystin degradation protein MlrC
MKVLFGGLIQESNTFNPQPSTLDLFEPQQLEGAALLTFEGRANELSGFIQVGRQAGANLVPLTFASAVSGGRLNREAHRSLSADLERAVHANLPCDGVLLALHGATVAEGEDDVCGDLLERLRKLLGPDVPLVVSLDLHANVTKKMLQSATALVSYRTFPHTDFFETGQRAARLLFGILETAARPQSCWVKLPMITPAENQQTSSGPMQDLFAAALEGEQAGRSICTSLFPVQPWLDLPDLGWSVVVIGDDLQTVQREANRLARLAWSRRHDFNADLTPPETAARIALDPATPRPLVLSESADSPGAGATATGVVGLRGLLEAGVHHRHTVFYPVVDAASVALCLDAGVGTNITLDVGHHLDTRYGLPLRVSGTVTHLSSGEFEFGPGYAPGTFGQMGRCAVLTIEGLSLLISERAVFTGDPAMYRSVGLEPTRADVVMVRSASQFRAGYEPIAGQILLLDTPGDSTARLEKLPFIHRPKPLFPFEDFQWSPPEPIIRSQP